MCGRFALIAPGAVLAEQFGLPEEPPIAPRYNIAPTQPVAAVREAAGGGRELTHFHWGLIPFWAKDPSMSARMINARSETVAEKPAFRAAFRYRRCLVPADGFFEWQKRNGRKQPIYIHGADGRPLAIAGIWERWLAPDGSEIESCSLLTTRPNALVAPIHDRMPVLIEPEDYATWLDTGLQRSDALQHLLRPYDADKLAAYPVGMQVNNARYDEADCVVAVGS
jgi:putative SOS response-associated peptidase YedK